MADPGPFAAVWGLWRPDEVVAYAFGKLAAGKYHVATSGYPLLASRLTVAATGRTTMRYH